CWSYSRRRFQNEVTKGRGITKARKTTRLTKNDLVQENFVFFVASCLREEGPKPDPGSLRAAAARQALQPPRALRDPAPARIDAGLAKAARLRCTRSTRA